MAKERSGCVVMRGMRKAVAPSWPKKELRSSVVMRGMRKAACSLTAKEGA
jgi:hypothetical protein